MAAEHNTTPKRQTMASGTGLTNLSAKKGLRDRNTRTDNEIIHRKARRYDVWEGSPEALVSAGIIEKELMPGQPGRNKFTVTINGKRGRTEFNESYIQIRKLSNSRVRVCKGISAAERESREEQAQKEMNANMHAWELLDFSRLSADEVREQLIQQIKRPLIMIMSNFGGLNISPAQQSVIVSHLADALRLTVGAQIKIDKNEALKQVRKFFEESGLAVPERYQPRLRLVTTMGSNSRV